MRVISGQWGGRRLVSFKASHIRPTTDLVKGSLFNSIQAEIEGVQVLDLFAGTGSLGLEALSRGAAAVTFVEKNPQSLRILQQNLDLLKVSPAQFKIVRQDVFQFLKKKSGNLSPLIVLIDPPFTEKWGQEVLEAVSRSWVLESCRIIALETSSVEFLDPAILSDFSFKKREFGDKALWLFRREEASLASE